MNCLPQPGEVFNPYRMFTGLFVPEALARSKSLSGGAKLAYGRLARYAGEDGQCFPTVQTLADEIGVGERQAQKYLAELEKVNLIRRASRFVGRGQTSNEFEFLWHEIFGKGVNDSSGRGVNDHSPPGVNNSSPKESQTEENHFEEKKRLRLSGHASQKPRCATRISSHECEHYPRLREALADYMQESPAAERIYPKDRIVVDVMDASGGASESEVVECLRYLREDRGLRCGTRSGPRRFAWFRTVVGDYFQTKRQRQAVSNATPAATNYRLSGTEFDAMTKILENIEGSAA